MSDFARHSFFVCDTPGHGALLREVRHEPNSIVLVNRRGQEISVPTESISELQDILLVLQREIKEGWSCD